MKKLLCIAISMLCIAIATVIPTGSAETVAEPISVTETETTTVTETETTTVIETTTEPPTKTMTVVATAYCSCVKCCGVYAKNRPNGVVYTASGAIAKANHTIAVDTKVIPFGTTVLIDGKKYVAEDTGSAVKGNKIDIYFDSHEQALEWGRQIVEIEVL